MAACPFAHSLAAMLECIRPVGLMDKASAPGAGDSRFESWAGHLFACMLCSLMKFCSAWSLILICSSSSFGRCSLVWRTQG